MNNKTCNRIHNKIKRRVSFILFFASLCVTIAAQDTNVDELKSLSEDSTTTTITLKQQQISIPNAVPLSPLEHWHPDPSKAMWYSVLCPGLGQIYNRSYWKVPVIYGGAAVFSYLISWQGRMYNDYSNAYYDFMDNDPNTVSYERLFRNIDGTDEWKRNTLKRKRDYYRRYRDLCVFGVGLLYVVNILDAFVDGHLYDFSVTNDLSFHVEPIIVSPSLNAGGNSLLNGTQYGLQCSFTF